VSQIERLIQRIADLQSAGSLLDRGAPEKKAIVGASGRITHYVMTPAARKKLSDAQKLRWENVRSAKLGKERAATSKFKEGRNCPTKS
jgi:hypothetical protein